MRCTGVAFGRFWASGGRLGRSGVRWGSISGLSFRCAGVPFRRFRASGGRLGRSGGLLVVDFRLSFRCAGVPFGRSWASGGRLGRSGGPLGVDFGALGVDQGALGARWGLTGVLLDSISLHRRCVWAFSAYFGLARACIFVVVTRSKCRYTKKRKFGPEASKTQFLVDFLDRNSIF